MGLVKGGILMIEYISPCAEIEIGPWDINRIIGFDVTSSCINPVDIAEIRIPIDDTVSAITKGMTVDIYQGYKEKGIWQLFSGTVVDVSKQQVITLYCKDRMKNLLGTKIIKAFTNVSPQEIVKFALMQAGITTFKLSSKQLARRHSFIANGINVVQVIKLVNKTWGLDWEYYFDPEGDFYYGPWEESERYHAGEEIIVFEYGQNIVDLKPSDDGTGELRTIAVPFLRHSQIIKIVDRRFWDTEVFAKVLRVQYHYGEKRTGMTIQWQVKKI